MRKAPPTASGQPTFQYGSRLGTGQRGSLGSSSGMRLRTGAPPTTASRDAAFGIALMQEVNIDNRPITQQGMSSMVTGQNRSSGRLIQDGNFFLGSLRQKILDIRLELSKLNEESDQHMKDSSQYGSLDLAYEALTTEVKNLEGTLADHNLAMDKCHTTANPRDIAAYTNELDERNRKKATELDKIFLLKQEKDKAEEETKLSILQIRKETEEKMKSSDPEKFIEYSTLVKRIEQLQEEMEVKNADINSISFKIRELKSQIGATGDQSFKKEYLEAEQEVSRLQREHDALLLDIELSTLEPKMAREKLLEKVKADQDRIKEIDFRMSDLSKEMDGMKSTIADIEADAKAGRLGNEIDPAKVEILRKRDGEMTEFIESFGASKEAALEEKQNLQHNIVALLNHISAGMDAKKNIPDRIQMRELQDESSFKDKQMKSSEVTMKRLVLEKEKRLGELANIDTLDKKIPIELDAISKKVELMKSEMLEFDDISGLSTCSNEIKQNLESLKSQYIERRDAMMNRVSSIEAAYEKVRREISSSEVGKGLETLEEKLRAYETNIFSMREFVESKGQEMKYEYIRTDCMKIVAQLNECIKSYEMVGKIGSTY